MTNNKAKYHDLLQNETSIPIFSRDWWMDAVCGEDNWDVLLVEKNDEIIASMPYYIHKKYGLKAITQPPLTQNNGPWIRQSTAKYAKRISMQMHLMNALIDQLPPHDYFCQNFSPYITNWLPLYWAGFQQTTRYTYVIEDLNDLENVWKNLLDSTRRAIRKAEKEVVIKNDIGLDKLIKVNELTFERQKLKVPYSDEFVRNIDNACMVHNARRMFFAEDAQGRIHAVLYIIWDSNTAHGLIGGGNPELRNSGAHRLLMWEAIKFASTISNVFDFGGSMIDPIEHFFRSFGAIQVPYFQISKMSRRMRVAQHGREIIKAFINR